MTAESGLVNPELLFFDRRLSLYDIYLIRKADIRYIVVDDRLAQGLPLYGTYIAAGEPSTRLTLAELTKFNSYPFIKRIYDNGPIQVYDVTSLLRPSARSAPAGPPVGGTGLNVGVFLLAAVVAMLWLRRLRRRPGRGRDAAHLVLCGVVGALVIGVFGAFFIRLTHLPPETVAIIVLLVLLGLSLRPVGRHRRDLRQGDSAVLDHTDTRSVALETSMRSSGLPDQVRRARASTTAGRSRTCSPTCACSPTPTTTSPLGASSTRPKRGIGGRSVSRLAAWAKINDVSFSDAIDRAAEAGLDGNVSARRRAAVRDVGRAAAAHAHDGSGRPRPTGGRAHRLQGRAGGRAHPRGGRPDSAPGRAGRRGRPFRRRHRVLGSSRIGSGNRRAGPGGHVGSALRR